MNLAWTTSPMWLIINALTAYRITRLWIDDTLPPLPRVRRYLQDQMERRWEKLVDGDGKFDRKYYPYTGGYGTGPGPLGNLLDCYWCSGFWISLAVVLAASLLPATVWTLIALPFALSALVGIIGTRV